MNRFVLGVFLGAALFPIVATSGQSRVVIANQRRQSIAVGDSELMLGMSRADVMNSFSKKYVVRENKTNGIDWLIAGKDDPDGPFLAGLSFTQDRLSAVIKPWLRGSTRGSIGAVGTGTAIHGILANFSEAGEKDCSLRAKHDDTPDHSSKVVMIKCGPKSLAISVTFVNGHGRSC